MGLVGVVFCSACKGVEYGDVKEGLYLPWWRFQRYPVAVESVYRLALLVEFVYGECG